MTIYIVTQSDHYYPLSGAGDWELVTRDLEGAKAHAEGMVAKERGRLAGRSYSTVYVLAINEDDLHVSEAWCSE